jgi:hyperosmotically inducible periplasmic protein
MRFFRGLIVGLIIGVILGWYIEKKAQEHPESEQRFEDSASKAGAAATDAAHNLSDALRAKLATLDLTSDHIQDEMSRTGKVVRRKAHEVAAKVEDAKIEAAIKAKYAADPDLSVWSISVSCHDGHVELSGTVPTPEGVGKAVALALEADGVQDVTSTLAIKPK